MTIYVKVIHVAINILYIFFLFSVINKETLVPFYFSVLIACIVSILLHELSHTVFALMKQYRIMYIRLMGIKVDFFNKKIKFDAGSMALKGQVAIDYAACLVDENTENKILKDIRSNFAVGALTTFFVYLFSTVMIILTKGLVFICFSWVNFNMLLSSCYKEPPVQDIYGYLNYEDIRRELIFVIFYQAVSFGTTTDYLYELVRNNICNKLKQNERLTKHDLNALIMMVTNKTQRTEDEIIVLLVENYACYKYDNVVLYYLLLCMIVIYYWEKMDLQKMYFFIMNEKNFTGIIKVPILGYRYIFYRMQYVAGMGKEKGRIWKRWDEERLGLM